MPFTWSADGAPVRGRQGLRITVDHDRAMASTTARELMLPSPSLAPATALDAAIVRLTEWYGADVAELIEMGMEYLPKRDERRRAAR